MRLSNKLAIFVTFVTITASATKHEHVWLAGKILDEGKARYYAGTYHNNSATTRTNGSINGTANSSTVGNSTNTNLNGNYSEDSNTSSSGFSTPIYRVYDNLMIEGVDTVYVTSERLRWRWSKGAHVAVNADIKYYVDGRKLHILDEDGKEHSVEILREIRKNQQTVSAMAVPLKSEASTASEVANTGPQIAPTAVSCESSPEGAEITVDGEFVGSSPSTIQIAAGQHLITISKKGFADWTRKITVSGGNIKVSADLIPN